jgi:hypothetical protein
MRNERQNNLETRRNESMPAIKRAKARRPMLNDCKTPFPKFHPEIFTCAAAKGHKLAFQRAAETL